MDAGAAVLERSDPGRVIHAHRIGCLLHVLYLFVNAEMAHVFFMGRLRKGSWHEGPKQHLVGLLGSLWYNMSRSDVFQHIIEAVHACGTWRVWDGNFDKPTETRWVVTRRAAAVLEGRWDQVLWALACFRVSTEQTAWGPGNELPLRALRDAQQSADACALQVCYCARREGAVLGVPLASRKGRLLDRARRHTAAPPLDIFSALTTSIYHDSSTIILSQNITTVSIFIFIYKLFLYFGICIET